MKERMNGVYWRENEYGFTMLEMLITLSITLIVLSLLPPLLSTVKTSYTNVSTDIQMTVFFNHLTRDIREAQIVHIDDGALDLIKGDGERYRIERVSGTSQMRRLREGTGHVLLLDRVHSFTCTSHHQLITCSVERHDGTKMKRSMAYYYLPVEVEEEMERDE